MPEIAQTRLNELYALASEIHDNIEQQSFRLQTLKGMLRALGADANPPATSGPDWMLDLE